MKIGIIGAGGIAPYHILAYKKIPNAEVTAVCDLNIERCTILANRFGIKNTFDNYFNMIDDSGIDVVNICTPINTHSKIVCDVAKHVSGIFLEKPMALSVSECDEIISTTEKYGTKLCINHNQLFSPNIMKIYSMINDCKYNLYSLKMVQKESFEYLHSLNLSHPWNVSDEHGGIIWEVCAHLGYILQKFLPDIKEVYALGGKTKYDTYDNFSVLLKTSTDRFGQIELNWVSKESEIFYEFTDLSGKRIKLYYWDNNLVEYKNKPSQTVRNVAHNIITDETRFFNKWYNFVRCYISKCKQAPMNNIIQEFVNSLTNNASPPVTALEGKNLIVLLDSIKKSLDEKKAVSIP